MNWFNEVATLCLWYFVLATIGFLTFPWLALVFRRLPDRGYGAARIAGLLTLAHVTWWLSSAGVRYRAETIFALLGLMAIACAVLLARNVRLRNELLVLAPKKLWRIELAVLAVFALAVVVRAFQPEIFWGEKPMDFTFFNYFSRLELLPPEDPWASDRPMRYYYLGNWMFAALQKTTGALPGVGYNLALVSIPTLAFGALVSALLPLVRRLRFALPGAALPLFLANTEALRLMFTGQFQQINFDFFWATSRILRHSVANEYPLWSFLFGDLHAHVMGLPGAALVLALFVGLLAQKKRPPTWRGFAMRAAVGAAWGAMFPVNGWDAIAYGVLIPVTLALRAPARLFRDAPRTALGRRAVDFGVVGMSAFAVAYPFWESILPITGSMPHDWTTTDFHDLSALWRFGAIAWIPLAAVALARSLRGRRRPRRTAYFGWQSFERESARTFPRRWDDWMRWLPLAVLAVFTFVPPYRETPWATLFTGGVILAVGWALRFGSGQSGNRRIVGALVTAGGVLFLFTECYWLVERMNSLFKLHYALWFVLAFAVAASMPAAYRATLMAIAEIGRSDRPVFRRAMLATSALLLALPIAAGLLGTVTAVGVMTTFHRVDGPRPTLDGTAYLSRTSIADAYVVEWLRKNAPAGSVILEAQGDSYREFTRISMHTGLPTVLGWEHHVKQRGTPPQEVEARRKDIETIYTTKDDAERLRLLDRYGVRYVVLTSVEKSRYGAERLDHWKRFGRKSDQRIRLAYDGSDSRIYFVAPPEPPGSALTTARIKLAPHR